MFIIFLGPPAVGKGTQASRLVAHLSAHHLSTGDMLRQVRREPSELGERLAELMDAGKLVSDEVVLDVVKSRMDVIGLDANYLFDGFPRTIAQAEALDAILSASDLAVNHVIELVVPDQVLVDRVKKRAALESRADDTPETVAKRVDIYREQTEPLVAFYGSRGIVSKVDGVGTVDEVFDRLISVLETGS